jgi:hypothetical protein
MLFHLLFSFPAVFVLSCAGLGLDLLRKSDWVFQVEQGAAAAAVGKI